MGRGTSVLDPVDLLVLSQQLTNQRHRPSFDRCPAKGMLEYVSDAVAGEVDIFAGKNFTSGETPCGVISGLSEPQGLAVSHHKLYVANTDFGGGSASVIRFPRGSIIPDKTYVDTSCGGEYPADVTVATDGTVIATDIVQYNCGGGGALSTWSKNGTFIGNFQTYNGANPYFITVQENGRVLYDDNSNNINKGSCPLGVCGAFIATGATFAFPGGLRSASGPKTEDVVLDDQEASGGGALTTYESFPTPVAICPLGGTRAVSYDFNHSDRHAFFADAGSVVATEVKWTDSTNTCTFVASVRMSSQPIGVAVDVPGQN
jgi:hypothetical protein